MDPSSVEQKGILLLSYNARDTAHGVCGCDGVMVWGVSASVR